MEKAGQLHNEHDDIRERLTRIEDALSSPLPSARVPIPSLVRELESTLLDHLAFEERGGLFVDLAAMRPSFDRRIADLMRQHVGLREAWTGLRQRLDAGDNVANLTPQLRDAIELVRRHDRDETDFVQDALLTDLGFGD